MAETSIFNDVMTKEVENMFAVLIPAKPMLFGKQITMENQSKKLSNETVQHKIIAHSFSIESIIIFYVNI